MRPTFAFAAPLLACFVVACSPADTRVTPAPHDSGVTTSAGGSTAAGGAAGQGGRGPDIGASGAAGGQVAPNSNAGGGTAGGRGQQDGGSGGTPVVTDGGGGVPAKALETIRVPASGDAVASKINLDSGELYLLKATGTVGVGTDTLDAEYGGFATGNAQDVVGALDVGIDVGFKVERTPNGTTAGRKKWFGSYRADHTYYVIVTGAGAPLSAKILRPAGGGGTGTIAVSVVRLSPTPDVAGVLETVKANVNKPTVHSIMTTDKSVVYLLQAAGSGKVGGANLGLGDADWMDWDAAGNGKVDIGDGNVDYGLGVDESNTAQTPRLRWWGPWRKDHTYFMLFAGTGSSIGFSYYDVGDYGDNSTTDKITVQILPVP
jgi:hypothetical protein